jgi:hypothetical protein
MRDFQNLDGTEDEALLDVKRSPTRQEANDETWLPTCQYHNKRSSLRWSDIAPILLLLPLAAIGLTSLLFDWLPPDVVFLVVCLLALLLLPFVR